MPPRKKTALIVDDEPEIRDLVSNHLTTRGFEVLKAENGVVAYSMISDRSKNPQNPPIDIIISDWLMPGGDGVELLKKIRAGDFHAIPFILVSGKVSREELDSAIKLDADGVILKPLPFGIIVQKIEEAMERRLKKDVSKM